ncbi:hypothetical protein AGABI1DRAFT_79378 [Agaricus bisporus var. burnettii JB137-S8]|uniref:Oxidoreductase AflY n=2 Tax=Agaricus bisporus var. burnettii TaxID=192524 RepID=K5XMJ8_AGABU|nr:uncharacterized protein AGABI1DRAFT_79378 [Agaricus bisporus var. burnettii JB137-S8]EKM75815.1 hypothetical protein AGABI1DRAFT_79378 [Agaricus bisporus var. burnettii JB137-S8]KAF7761461.1 hypothetical protein Agabi119p4_9453 [Agaricus bisporus var. burnettii]
MASLYSIRKRGLLNLPGITPASKALAEKLVREDAEQHHSLFNPKGFHNHLNNQLLAAYDMGAQPGVIQKIYNSQVQMQRPILVEDKDKDIVVNKDNWPDHLGEQEAYNSYSKFFAQEIERLGILDALETYIFEPEANANGRNMLDRLFSGAMHPFILLGYGLEFGIDALVANGLASTAIHADTMSKMFPYSAARGDNATAPFVATGPGKQPSAGPSLLEILRQACDTDTLIPPSPYQNEKLSLIFARAREIERLGMGEHILRLCQPYTFSIPNDASDEELRARAEEFIWVATLLMFATGREGRETRLDFFLMHLVTFSAFLESYLTSIKNTRSKVMLLRHMVPIMVTYVLLRGRPVINADLIQRMSLEARPPFDWDVLGPKSDTASGLGDLKNAEDYDPWPALITAGIHHPDLHLAKAMRTLIHASRNFGHTPAGEVIGAFRPVKSPSDKPEETFKGMAKVDGTLFVRAAGVMMDFMGWTIVGQKASSPTWDTAGVGFDETWEQPSK